MKILGQPASWVVFAIVVWALSIAHPMTYLQSRHVALNGSPPDRATAEYAAAFGRSEALAAALRGKRVIGYVSESPIDVRVGGPLQARYYLSQYALAPVLLELETPSRAPSAGHEFVLANFQNEVELEQYLARTSRRIVASISGSVALTAPGERE